MLGLIGVGALRYVREWNDFCILTHCHYIFSYNWDPEHPFQGPYKRSDVRENPSKASGLSGTVDEDTIRENAMGVVGNNIVVFGRQLMSLHQLLEGDGVRTVDRKKRGHMDSNPSRETVH